MKQHDIQKLVRIANSLDELGMHSIADEIDAVVKNAAETQDSELFEAIFSMAQRGMRADTKPQWVLALYEGHYQWTPEMEQKMQQELPLFTQAMQRMQSVSPQEVLSYVQKAFQQATRTGKEWAKE